MVVVRINENVPLDIFNHHFIRGKIEKLFSDAEEKMKMRYEEIIKFLQVQPIDVFSYSSIVSIFKMYFYKSILSEAIKITFSEQGRYDALLNIKDLLSKERLEDAIFGTPMIDAFAYAIHNKDNRRVFAPHLGERSIRLLEIKYLGKTQKKEK